MRRRLAFHDLTLQKTDVDNSSYCVGLLGFLLLTRVLVDYDIPL